MTNTKTENTVRPIKVITGTDAIKAAINSIQNRGAKLDRDIQQAAISTMQHHADHGDVTLINALIEAMPQGSRVNALREMIMKCSTLVAWDDQAKVFKHNKGGAFDLEKAQSKMWTTYKPEQPYRPFDLQAQVKKLLTAASKAADEKDAEKAAKNNITDEQYKELAQFAAKMGVTIDG